jgi:hypothetical protein
MNYTHGRQRLSPLAAVNGDSEKERPGNMDKNSNWHLHVGHAHARKAALLATTGPACFNRYLCLTGALVIGRLLVRISRAVCQNKTRLPMNKY